MAVEGGGGSPLPPACLLRVAAGVVLALSGQGPRSFVVGETEVEQAS